MKQTWYGVSALTPPVLQHVLLADDNDFYAKSLINFFALQNTKVTYVTSAQAAIALLAQPNSFDGVITDISMETELAGLKVLAYCKKIQFSGKVAAATTALNSFWGFFVNQWIFAWYGADFLIPKKLIRKNQNIIWLPSKKNFNNNR